MNALQKTNFPVPRTYILCEDPSIIGTSFYLMQFIRGRIFRDLKLPGLNPNDRRAIYDELNRVLAHLHSIPIASIGLSDFGKPGNYYERQVFPILRNFSEPRYPSGLGNIQSPKQKRMRLWTS
jgi:aminoglycoside phosphotransferase (APT) family kinase protein